MAGVKEKGHKDSKIHRNSHQRKRKLCRSIGLERRRQALLDVRVFFIKGASESDLTYVMHFALSFNK